MKSVLSCGASASVPANTATASTRVISRCRSDQPNTGRYALCSQVSFSSAPSACSFASCLVVGRMNHDASTGTTVRDTNRDASSEIVTVIAKGRKISPACPPTSPIGRNTATVVRVELVTAPATSLTALMIESRPHSPSPWWRLMFSITTIESSTTRPIATVSAPSVRMLSV